METNRQRSFPEGSEGRWGCRKLRTNGLESYQ